MATAFLPMPTGPWAAPWARAAGRQEVIAAQDVPAIVPAPGFTFPVNYSLCIGPRFQAGYDVAWFPLVPMEGQ